MKSIKLSWLFLLPASAVLFGCDEISKDGNNLGEVQDSDYMEAHLTEVWAEKCSNICDLIVIKIKVSNKSNGLICIPSVYNDQFIDASVVFLNEDRRDAITSLVPSDPNVFLSQNYQTDMISLTKLTQYVLQPGEQRVIEAHMYKKFELTKQPYSAKVRFMGYPCSDKALKRFAPKIMDLSQDVVFK